MSLNIKNPETHALAERIAKLTGETLTETVTTALRERLERIERSRGFDEDLYKRLEAIAADCRKNMKEPYLSAEIGDLLYDEMGMPK